VFSEIAIVDGSGNSSIGEEYSYVDESPAPGVYYYRLIQVDFDGTKKTYNIAESIRVLEGIHKKVKCFPNPFVSDMNIKFMGFTGDEIKIVVYNCHGQQVGSKALHQFKNEFVYSLDLAHLESDVYFIFISAGDYSETVKCVKKDVAPQ